MQPVHPTLNQQTRSACGSISDEGRLMKKRLLLTALALLLAMGTIQLARAFSVRQVLANAADNALVAKESLLVATQSTLSQTGNATFAGDYSGEISLQFSVDSVYSDTIAYPSAEELNVAPMLGTIDFGLQISQSLNLLSGYVDLDKTLVFSAAHTIQQGSSTLKIGPTIQGSINGVSITIESEQVSSQLDGQTILRQFRLVGEPDPTDNNVLHGEYRETVWGYLESPMTIVGQFNLQRIDFEARRLAEINNTPLTVADTVSTTRGVSVTISVLANDSDLDADSLTITGVSRPYAGTATVSGDTIVYQPLSTYVGVDSFTYVVSDGRGGSAGATVSVQVQDPTVPNQPPVATNDSQTIAPNSSVTINVLANDSDPNGDTLFVTIEIAPQHGDAIIQNGQIVYTPDASFVGTDVITYRVSDGMGGSATATVTITVTSGQTTESNRVYLPLINR